MTPSPASDAASRLPPAGFSQTNKICFRATATQCAWLSQHLASPDRSITRVLRDALDLYIATHSSTTPHASDRQERAC